MPAPASRTPTTSRASCRRSSSAARPGSAGDHRRASSRRQRAAAGVVARRRRRATVRAAGLSPLAIPHRRGRRLRVAGAPAASRSRRRRPRQAADGHQPARASRCRQISRPARRCARRRAAADCGPRDGPAPWPEARRGRVSDRAGEDRQRAGQRAAIAPEPIRCSRRRCTAAGMRRARPSSAACGTRLVRRAEPRSAPSRVAAFGTRVVQEHQEALMASAWEQAGDLQRANQRMRQLQLSLVVGTSLHARHFGRMSDDALLRVSAPALARLRAGADGSASGAHAGRPIDRRRRCRRRRRARDAAHRRARGPITPPRRGAGLARSATPACLMARSTAATRRSSRRRCRTWRRSMRARARAATRAPSRRSAT